jgi:hypothetical protein
MLRGAAALSHTGPYLYAHALVRVMYMQVALCFYTLRQTACQTFCATRHAQAWHRRLSHELLTETTNALNE